MKNRKTAYAWKVTFHGAHVDTFSDELIAGAYAATYPAKDREHVKVTRIRIHI